MPHLTGLTSDRDGLLVRFWRSALGFWRGLPGRQARFLAVLLVATVILQLWVQYSLNVWSRDFFNTMEQKNQELLRVHALNFVPLAAASLMLAVGSVWGRMTVQREWRRWLSNHLYDYWLRGRHYAQLRFMPGDHNTPEYRIAEDARIATDLPVDLALGLFSSILTAITFIGVLYSVGSGLEVTAFGFKLTVPGYLVIAVVAYSLLLTTATLLVGRRLSRVIEENKGAEAELRATGAQLRAIGEASSFCEIPRGRRRGINEALEQVMTHWRAFCWQLMRMTLVSHTNSLVAPSIGLLLCAPKYLAGTMTLGSMVQAAAAFVIVQGAFNWIADNYGRMAEWASSARRVASLLVSLDQIEGTSRPKDAQLTKETLAADRP
jgi:putative ATP-binding cassette transporter